MTRRMGVNSYGRQARVRPILTLLLLWWGMAPEPQDDGGPQTPTAEAWKRVQLARHPKRPHALDYIERVFTDFQEIHGDRGFGDDPAIVAGAAQFGGRP